MSADVVVTRRVAAPADVVWHVLTDWPAQGAWMPLTRVDVLGPGDGREVGARLEAWTGVGRAGFLDTMVVTAWDPPCRCEVLHTGRLVRGPGVFAVRPLGPRECEVLWEVNRPGMSGDSVPWEGWSHAREYVEEVPG
ncbi:SRPBCC family protein, partial [Jiangella rhizosphaerae]